MGFSIDTSGLDMRSSLSWEGAGPLPADEATVAPTQIDRYVDSIHHFATITMPVTMTAIAGGVAATMAAAGMMASLGIGLGMLGSMAVNALASGAASTLCADLGTYFSGTFLGTGIQAAFQRYTTEELLCYYGEASRCSAQSSFVTMVVASILVGPLLAVVAPKAVQILQRCFEWGKGFWGQYMGEISEEGFQGGVETIFGQKWGRLASFLTATSSRFCSEELGSVRLPGVESDAKPNSLPKADELRDYQVEAVTNTLSAITRGDPNGIIVLPTGTGKTVTFTEVVRQAQEKSLFPGPGGKPKKTLVLVHRVELVDQIKKKMDTVLGPGKTSVVAARYEEINEDGTEIVREEKRDFSGEVVVAMVQTLANEDTMRQLNPEDYGLVVVDETHHIVANQWQAPLAKLGLVDDQGNGVHTPGKFLLGVTATPDRSDGVPLGKVFGDRLLFSRPLSWFVLHPKKYLLKPLGTLVTTGADMSRVKRGADGDYEHISLGEAMSEDPVLARVVQAYDEQCPGERALVFAASVGHAHALVGRLNQGQEKPRAKVIDGTMSPSERSEIIRGHRSGEFDILINYGVLTEGYDDPGIQAVLIARPTMSRSLYAQMVGRGLRPDPAHPERGSVKIIDFTSNIHDHDLEIDLARYLGTEYPNANELPPLDVISLNQKVMQSLKKSAGDEEEARRDMLAEDVGGEDLEYMDVAMLKIFFNPFSGQLTDILYKRYDGDFTRMAWALGITEARLNQYIWGAWPNNRDRIASDLQHAERALGMTQEALLSLWDEANQHLSFQRLEDQLTELHGLYPTWGIDHLMMSLKARLREWKAKTLSAAAIARLFNRCAEEDPERFARIDALLEAHAPESFTQYRRSHAKRDLAILIDLARASGAWGSDLLQKALAQGALSSEYPQNLPDRKGGPRPLNFAEFLELCRKRVLDPSILDSLSRKNKWKSQQLENPNYFAEAMTLYQRRLSAGETPTLTHFLDTRYHVKPEAVGGLCSTYLTSERPLPERKKVYQWAQQQGIALARPAFITDYEPYYRLRLSRTPEDNFKAYLMVRRPDQEDRVLKEDRGFLFKVFRDDFVYYVCTEKFWPEVTRRLLKQYPAWPPNTVPEQYPLPACSEGLSPEKLTAMLSGTESANYRALGAHCRSLLKLEDEALAASWGSHPGYWGYKCHQILSRRVIPLFRDIFAALKVDRGSTHWYQEDFFERVTAITGLPEMQAREWLVSLVEHERPSVLVKGRRPVVADTVEGKALAVVAEMRKQFALMRTTTYKGITRRRKDMREALEKVVNLDELLTTLYAARDAGTLTPDQKALVKLLIEGDELKFERPKPKKR